MDREEVRLATLAWLSRRDPPPPYELERRVRRAVERVTTPGATIPETLVAAAFACLEDSARTGAQRSAANELLAADALLTYGAEAAAEEGEQALEEYTRALDLKRFTEAARNAAG